MPLFARWRSEREGERRASRYVQAILEEPADETVDWLARSATRGDEDHARWELRYARRAIGFLVAQRDALDDRTGSIVARALTDAFSRDDRIAEGMHDLAQRQFNSRLSAYRDALAARTASAQLGQTLLAFAGGSFRHVDDNVNRAGEVLADYEREANRLLREIFGAAALPEHAPPSSLSSDQRR